MLDFWDHMHKLRICLSMIKDFIFPVVLINRWQLDAFGRKSTMSLEEAQVAPVLLLALGDTTRGEEDSCRWSINYKINNTKKTFVNLTSDVRTTGWCCRLRDTLKGRMTNLYLRANHGSRTRGTRRVKWTRLTERGRGVILREKWILR